MRDRSPQSFGVQAARFCLYAPFLFVALNFTVAKNLKGWPNVALGFLVCEAIGVLAALGLGIYALASMRRNGSRGILGRAIVGLALNGLLLFGFVGTMRPIYDASRVRKQLAGTWTLTSAPTPQAGASTITFNADGTFGMKVVADEPLASVAGRWQLDSQKLLAIEVTRVDVGEPNAVGQKMGLGYVLTIDDTQMTLKVDKGAEHYTRTR